MPEKPSNAARLTQRAIVGLIIFAFPAAVTYVGITENRFDTMPTLGWLLFSTFWFAWIVGYLIVCWFLDLSKEEEATQPGRPGDYPPVEDYINYTTPKGLK